MTHQEVEKRAAQVLRKSGTYRAPIPMEALLNHLNLRAEAAPLGQNVSGMLVAKDERGAIGYNSLHAIVRQRFTIAHEIAHFVLHVKKNRRLQLFIDRDVIFRRDRTGSDRQEVQANRFAEALLMPASLVSEELRKHDLDLDDEDAFKFLAKRFQVGITPLSNRLLHLGVLLQ
jgi:Zn-dependent peptidase ImmA (M78 family)